MESCYFEREKEKLYGMLPGKVRAIVPQIQQVCDAMEYNGSRMFDEYPDAGMVSRLCERLTAQLPEESQDMQATVHVLVVFEWYSRRCRVHETCERC